MSSQPLTTPHTPTPPPHDSGYIDAKLVGSPDLLPCLLPLASSRETEVRLHVAEALADLALQPQNRQAVVRSGGVSSLVLLLEEAAAAGGGAAGRGLVGSQGEVAEHALRALYYLAMDQDSGAGGGGGGGAGGGAGGAGAGGGAGGGGGGSSSSSRSPCLLIAKEGGLTPLVAILRSLALQQRPAAGLASDGQQPPPDGSQEQELGAGAEDSAALSGAILSNAIAFLAIMSQHGASRVAMFQAVGLVENLLAAGIHALWQVEQGPQQQQQQQLLLTAASSLSSSSSSSGKQKLAPPPPPPPQQPGGPEGGPHLRGAALQAVHLAYTLANLASCGEGRYARGLVEAGAVPVLLQMCRCRVPEVVDQAVRGLALCCRPLTRGFAVAAAAVAEAASASASGGSGDGVEKPRRPLHGPLAPLRSLEETQDEQLRLLWANEALQTLLALLAAPGSSPVVRLEAVKGLGALARVPDFGVAIVRGGALCDLLKLAVDSTTAGQKQLAGAAEEALVALGVEGGSKALEVCGNDRSLLLDWWGMERALEEQREAQGAELAFAVEAMMDADGERGGAGGAGTGQGGLSNSASGSAGHGATGAAAGVGAYPRWAGGGGAGGGPLVSPGSGSGGSGGGGGGIGGGLVGTGLGGLGGIIKEVANLRLRDLLTMCLAPGSAALPSSSAGGNAGAAAGSGSGSGSGGLATSGSGAPASLSLSGSGRHSSLHEGLLDAIPVALQALPFRGAASSGGGGGQQGGSGGGGRRETLLSALIQTARRQPSADSYALPPRRGGLLPYEPCLTSPIALPEVGALTYNMQRLMDRYFPSRLLQQEVIPLLALGTLPPQVVGGAGESGVEWVRAEGGVGGVGVSGGSRGLLGGGSHGQGGRFEAARPPTWRAVQMPSRTYFSFRREGRVLSKILKKHAQEADLWHLSFVDSAFEGEWSVSFLERVHLLPKIRYVARLHRIGLWVGGSGQA